MVRRNLGLLVVIGVVGVAAGCGGGDEESSPTGAAEEFMAAVQADDTDAACALVDEEYIAENYDSFGDAMVVLFGTVSSGDDCATYVDGIPVTVRNYEGATAEIADEREGFTDVTISWPANEAGQTVQMREVDGEWLLAGEPGF